MREIIAGPYRPCLHWEQERVRIPKICIHKYECGHCSFDQWLDAVREDQGIRESQRSPEAAMAKAA